jgi:DNA-binding response OmpR family regulator
MLMAGSRILVVEDDDAVREGLVDALGLAGYDVIAEENGKTAIDRVRASTDLDLVLLDIMLPGCDGFTVLEEIRGLDPALPVILVTARGAASDRVRGLTDGADDYVVKPFNARELLARVRAVLRRSPDRTRPVRVIRAVGLRIDLDRREVRFDDGRARELSDREAEILRYLALHHGRAVQREELLRQLWGINSGRIRTRTLDMHVSRLREKLEHAELIVTVRSFGYKLTDAVSFETT